ncbi:MAG: adenylosuccinate lyase family protein, partial [Pseudomonadota bacterium]
ASSTMPQKQNPVGPSALVALHAAHVGLQAALDGAAVHQHQRDGAAWFTEWLVLPQIILGGAAALERAVDVAQGLEPRPDAMAQALGGLGLAHAEALSFALAARMPRPDAQAAVKALCRTAQETSTPLETLARAAYDDVPPDLFAADALGQAPSDARRFAAAVRAAL